MTGLEVSGLTARYGAAPVLRGVDLVVRPGEVAALLGANGAGKTTLLRSICGAVAIDTGCVSVDGCDVTRLSTRAIAARHVGYIPEGRGVFSSLTVEEHFRVGPRGMRLDVSEALARFPALRPLLRRRVALLSGGEQQMLALACGLARKPRVLLIDEMSMGLAPMVVRQILPIVRQFASENGTAVLLVEQSVYQALAIADRAYVLARGQVAFSGSAAELLSDRKRLVASYLGDSAIVEPNSSVAH